MAKTQVSERDPNFNDGYVPKKDYVRVDYAPPHWNRRKSILEVHPEVTKLQHIDHFSSVWVLICVSFVTGVAYLVRDSNTLVIFLASYIIGATVLHAQWVLIHELTHDLVFENQTLNTIFLLICNLPHIIPSGISFRHYHRQHHGHLSETYTDPDVPSPLEDKLFGHSRIGKAVWLCFFSLIQAIRVMRHSTPFALHIDLPSTLNFVLNFIYAFCIYQYFGVRSVVFLVLSSLMAVGLFMHPLGARWVAEHYAVHPNQETYSYYGNLNYLMFNIGYHNEHHDFPNIPWNKLPRLKRLSPEFYESLHSHSSYLRVLWEFLNNYDFTLRSRVVRWPKNQKGGGEKDD